MNQSKGKARPQTSRPSAAKRAQNNNSKPRQPKMAMPGILKRNFIHNKQSSVASAYATRQSTGNATIFRNNSDSCRIIHRELVGSVVGSVNYVVGNTFSINPGLSNSFPWLAVQAQGWEKYKFNKLKLCYYTRTGSNTPGSVILSPDYDAADSAPVNEQIASAYHGTEEDVAWKDDCLTFDPKRLNQERFIRLGGLAANLDIKTYDVANAYVGTLDGTAIAWGKLWFEYDITLINQQLNSSGPQGAGELNGNGGSKSAAIPFGLLPVTTGSYNITAAGPIISMTGLSIGTEYCITITADGTVLTNAGIGTFVGLTSKTGLFGGTNAAATIACTVLTVTATANVASFTWTITATTVSAAQLVISALSPAPGF